MGDRRYFVYIMTSNSLSTMYVGVTNDVGRRVCEHRAGIGSKFVSKYRVTRLVYVEEYENPTDAITREKQLKGWKRIRKNELVRAANPGWNDLMPAELRRTSPVILSVAKDLITRSLKARCCGLR